MFLGLGLMTYLISNNQTHRSIYYISETGGCKRFLNKKKRIQAHHSVFSQFHIYLNQTEIQPIIKLHEKENRILTLCL